MIMLLMMSTMMGQVNALKKDTEKEDEMKQKDARDRSSTQAKGSSWTGGGGGAKTQEEGGRRRLETHVDENDVLHLLQHEPVKLTLEEAQDWQHVKRKLAEARRSSGWLHSIPDAYIPSNSALRDEESRAAAEERERQGAEQAEKQQANGKEFGAGRKSGRWESFKKYTKKATRGVFDGARRMLNRDTARMMHDAGGEGG